MLWNDLRYALPLMRRSPDFTAVAVLSLALRIGANTAIFSLFNTVVLRKLPVAHQAQLVELLQKYRGEPRGGYFEWASLEHFRESQSCVLRADRHVVGQAYSDTEQTVTTKR